MSSRLSALLVWSLVAASAVFWALRLSSSPLAVPDGAALATQRVLAGGDLSALLGRPASGPAINVAAAPPPEASRFRLTGIVATAPDRRRDSPSSPGVALISVDGAPPRAYRVGDVIDSNLALRSVALRSANIGDRSAVDRVAFVLELPPPTPAATGSLQASQFSTPGAPPTGQPPMPMPPQPMPAQPMSPQPMPASSPPAGLPMQSLSPQMAPGVQVQGLPPGVHVQLPPPDVQGNDEQTQTRTRSYRQ